MSCLIYLHQEQYFSSRQDFLLFNTMAIYIYIVNILCLFLLCFMFQFPPFKSAFRKFVVYHGLTTAQTDPVLHISVAYNFHGESRNLL